MPKTRTKVKKSMVSSTTTIIGICDELDVSICCSNRNCPSHWHDRLTEKLKNIQQSKLKTSNPPSLIKSKKLSYPDILSKLFQINESDDNNHEIYSTPVSKSIIINKHNLFMNQLSKRLDNSTYSFINNNLNIQMKYRMIPLVADPFSDQV